MKAEFYFLVYSFVCLMTLFFLFPRRGHMEKSSIKRDFPVAKVVYPLLRDNVSSSFCYPGWNKGRIICQKSQLKRILLGTESSEESKSEDLFSLSNTELPIMDTQSYRNDVRRQHGSAKSETSTRKRKELMTSAV